MVKDYVNERVMLQREYFQKAAEHSSAMEQVALKISNFCQDFQSAVKECEDREHVRAVDVKKKQATIQLVASAIEVAWEVKTLVRQVKKGGKKGGEKGKKEGGKIGIMDVGGLLMAISGTGLGTPLTLMSVTSQDIPRSCERAIRLDKEISLAIQEMLSNAMLWTQYNDLASQEDSGIAANPNSNTNPSESEGGP